MVADSVTFKAKFGRGGTRKRKRARSCGAARKRAEKARAAGAP
jgi:hypothetical protein